MLEAQAATAVAQAAAQAAAAKQEQMMERMEQLRAQLEQLMQQQADDASLLAKAGAEMMAQQEREMALLTQEFKALGSKADSEATAPADKKSSACALQ
jgi:hypothetical protein